ncbi:MAG: Hsp70 family protein [Desulfatibacillaceae bacterium]
MESAQYIIGIDLGTTNSVVAYTEVNPGDGEGEIRFFSIPQLVASGSVGEQQTLPSFILMPGPNDVGEGALSLPWNRDAARAVGVFARDRGAELPGRLVSSAKSWLCHAGVDRNKAILPWEGPDDEAKLSPVEAQAAILGHIRDAWNHGMAGDDPSARMEDQEILLTVPASFDAVARELTARASEMAGFGHVTLLEEPQAAFYAWLYNSGDKWRERVSVGDHVLVCDVGGGTSDFSLIEVTEEDGDLVLDRVAVGDHLLVGGDNMDLAMAHYTAARLRQEGKKKLDSWQMRGLWQSCRAAKEKLFAEDGPEAVPVTILGRGSSLIGGTIKTELGQEEITRILTDGFFPRVGRTAEPDNKPGSGMRELGLPYAKDPAITKHLARFVNRREDSPLPTAVLFNGGVMKAAGLRGRVLDVLGDWAGAEVRELAGIDCDLAVARGAAYYGLARRGRGIRIRGGLARSYYIGVEASMPAVPGLPAPLMAVCVAPFGMEEGTETDLPGREFGLVVGEQANFEFLGSNIRTGDEVGEVVEDWEDEIEPITTLETMLEGEPGEEGSVLPVRLHARVTEVGTLELSCVARDDDRSWQLEFDVREKEE